MCVHIHVESGSRCQVSPITTLHLVFWARVSPSSQCPLTASGLSLCCFPQHWITDGHQHALLSHGVRGSELQSSCLCDRPFADLDISPVPVLLCFCDSDQHFYHGCCFCWTIRQPFSGSAQDFNSASLLGATLIQSSGHFIYFKGPFFLRDCYIFVHWISCSKT